MMNSQMSECEPLHLSMQRMSMDSHEVLDRRRESEHPETESCNQFKTESVEGNADDCELEKEEAWSREVTFDSKEGVADISCIDDTNNTNEGIFTGSSSIQQNQSNSDNSTNTDYEILENEVLSSPSNQYRVLECLGRGTFGKVFKCCKLSTNKILAVKITKNDAQSRSEAVTLAVLYAEGAHRFNIVRGYESFVHRNRRCLVQQILGLSLSDFLKQRSFEPLPLSYIRPILQQVFTALWKLKSMGLIHADLKPQNIMLVDPVNRPCRIKVIDFGSATTIMEASYDSYIQTRCYRAPEIILGLPFCEAVDMWSLGCVAAELFLGCPLFPGSSEFDQIRYISHTNGLPSDEMLEMASQTARFFCHNSNGSSKWRLKTVEEYETESGLKCKEKRVYKLSCLDAIGLITTSTLEGDELAATALDRKAFIVILKGMLQVEQKKRVTPEEGLGYPFISLNHLVDYRHCESTKASVQMMKVCRNTS